MSSFDASQAFRYATDYTLAVPAILGIAPYSVHLITVVNDQVNFDDSANNKVVLTTSLLAGRRRVTDNKGPMHEVKMAPMELTPDTGVDFSRRAARTSLDEYWGVLYDNGKVPGVWASIKSLIVYVIPVKSSRGAGVGGR